MEKRPYQTADIFTRFCAFLIESICLIWVPSYFLYGRYGIDPGNLTRSDIPFAIMFLFLIFCSDVVVFPINFFLLKYAETSFGKMFFGLKVRSIDDKKLSNRQIVSRELFSKPISSKIIIGYPVALIRKDSRAFHDLLAKTMVIKKDKSTSTEKTKVNPGLISLAIQGFIFFLIISLPVLYWELKGAMEKINQ